MWTELQQVVMDKRRSGAMVILNGKPDKQTRGSTFVVSKCGHYVCVPYSCKGSNAQGDDELARGRQKLFEFVMLPHRAQDSELRPQV